MARASGLVVGQRVNRLTVLRVRRVTHTFRTGAVRNIKLVLARCTCGNKKWIRHESITHNLSKSCGCLNKEPRCADPKLRAARRVMAYLRVSARNRGLVFSLIESEVAALVCSACTYCGQAPTRVFRGGREEAGAATAPCNGIDRVDSAHGYVTGNVVPCCRHCNTMKFDLTVEEFLTAVGRVARRAGVIRKYIKELT